MLEGNLCKDDNEIRRGCIMILAFNYISIAGLSRTPTVSRTVVITKSMSENLMLLRLMKTPDFGQTKSLLGRDARKK